MLIIKQLRFLLFFIFIFANIYIIAQSPNFIHYTVENNLPSSECYQVLQDKKGFIWVASDKGVARYDGNKFQNFTKEDGLPENCIIRMYEDPSGRIWFAGVSNKIAYFENNKITCLKINDKLSKKVDFGIISSLAFYDNSLWLGMYTTSNIYKISFTKRKSPNPLKHQKLLEINQKKKLIGGYIYKFKNGEYIQGWANIKSLSDLKSASNFNYILGNRNIINKNILLNCKDHNPNVRSCKSVDNNFLFNYSNKIIKVNHLNGKVTKEMNFNSKINYLFSDSKNGIWIGTDKNGLIYYPKGNVGKSNPLIFLKNKSISCIIEDHEHGFWISTLDDGIFYIKNIHFYHLTGLSSLRVNAISYNQNCLFAALDNGHILTLKNNLLSERNVNEDTLNINFIRKINQNKIGSIAIGGSKGFCYLDLITNKINWIKTYWWTEIKPTVNNIPTVSFIKSKIENTYWIANYSNLIKVHDSDKTKIIPFKDRIFSLAEDDNGIIWLGSLNGLYSYDGRKQLFQGKNSTVLSGRINEIQIKNNTIWTATKDNGVAIKKGKTIYEITTKNGLTSNICQSLFLESDKIAWISTNKGISKISVQSWTPFRIKIKTYNSSNGLISNEVNQITKHKNTIYIASNKGITWFDEKKVNSNLTSPPIHITNIQINKRDTSIKSNYFLPYNKNNITLNYIGLTYKSEGDIEYKYQLQGLDTSWNYTHNSTIPYAALPYGNYTFMVSAKNNDGYWSKIPAKIYFRISPPFWHSWTFRILAGITFLTSIYWFIKWRINKVEKRANENAKLYQQTIEMEMKFLSSQMNPHFTFNAMNSIQYYMMENEPEKAQKYLVKYSKLIRKVLENNMKKYVPLAEEIEMLGLYMDIESLRFKIQFGYEIYIQNEIKELNISIPPMIIQPYIENAIWHGLSNRKEFKGNILLSFELTDNKIKCSIEDNGIGRAKSKELKSNNTQRESLGMLITHQRLQQLHSESEMEIEPEIIDLIDENGIGCGTKVVIYLPYLKEIEINSVFE